MVDCVVKYKIDEAPHWMMNLEKSIVPITFQKTFRVPENEQIVIVFNEKCRMYWDIILGSYVVNHTFTYHHGPMGQFNKKIAQDYELIKQQLLNDGWTAVK